MKKRVLIGLFLLLFIIQLVNAAEVCVVVDYGGYGEEEPDSKCIDIDEGKNGYDVLEATGFDILWSPESTWGQMVCKINDIGTDIQGTSCYYDPNKQEFWNFALVDGTKWGHSPVGLNGGDECWNRDFSWSDWSKVVHYCVKDGDMLGFAFGKGGAEPEMFKANTTKIDVDGKKQSDSKTRSGKIVDVFPGSVVEFKIELENLYDSSTDIEITDISIEGTIEEINDGDDIDEEISDFDLGADRKKTEELKFEIPLEVEAKDRLVKIEIKAEDDAGIKYEKEFTYDLEVEKENHKLKILKAELDKGSYKCGENALLDFSIINIGKDNENVDLEITNEDLKIDINENFELSDEAYEESSKYEKKFNLWLPENISKTTYPIIITATYGSEKETESVNLVVSECEEEKGIVKESEEVTEVKTGEISDKMEETELEEEVKPALATTLREKIGGNLPLILTLVLGVLILAIILLLVIFSVFRK